MEKATDCLSLPGSLPLNSPTSRLNQSKNNGSINSINDMSSVRSVREFSRQYAHTYFIRLSSLRPILEAKIKEKWTNVPIKRISELCESSGIGQNSPKKKGGPNSPNKNGPSSPNKKNSPKKKGGPMGSHEEESHGQHISLHNHLTVCIIGTIFKQQSLKPSILQELVDEIQLTDRTIREKWVSDSDIILLEDETTRVRLVPSTNSINSPNSINESISNKFNIGSLVNGIVVGVKGRPTIDGKFDVEDILFPTPSPAIWPKNNDSSQMVFVSGLNLNGDEIGIETELLFEHLSGLAGSFYEQNSIISQRNRVFFLGNSLNVPISTSTEEIYKKIAQAAQKLDQLFSQLAKTMEVFVVSGRSDPVESMYPQPPLHSCLFPLSTQYSQNFHLLSNPTSIKLSTSSLKIILSDGATVKNALSCSTISNEMDMGCSLLEWGHLGPTAPDTLPLSPGGAEDEFIIRDNLPHFWIFGSKEGGVSEFLGSKVIGVPQFSGTKKIVIVGGDYGVKVMSFGINI